MEIVTIREAVAWFEDSESLESAVSDLQSNGVDRADLGILVPGGSPAASGPGGRSAREAVVSDTDLRQGRVLGTGLVATIAGFAAAGVAVATGGAAAAAIAAAAAAAGGAGVVGTLVGNQFEREHSSLRDARPAGRGILLCVRTRDSAAEKTVLDVLRRYSATAALHDRPLGGTPGHSIGA
jgi:hypothetical protein